MFVFPPNSYTEILIPNVIVLGDGAFVCCLGHEGENLISGISAFIKDLTELPCPSHHMRINESLRPKKDPHAGMLTPLSQTFNPQNCEK